MKKIPSLFTFISLLVIIGVMGGVIINNNQTKTEQNAVASIPTTKYGAFLATQHAMYVNDFARAADFAKTLSDVDYRVVNNTKILSEFLNGKLPLDADALKTEKTLPAQLIYDAYLVQNERWEDFYKRHKTDDSALSAPLRIWSSVSVNRITEALKFIDTLSTNDSWKSFVRGQIYAYTNQNDKAASEFQNVRPDFMNISDYLYIMSFYKQNNMSDVAKELQDKYTSAPGGVFMTNYNTIPDWNIFSGIKNNLAFSLTQNVAHTQVMTYSDLAILLLSFADVTFTDYGAQYDAINYYKGQYFFNNSGDFAKYFNKISADSPYYPFATLRIAEKSNDIKQLQNVLDKNPLFMPAVNRVVAHYVQHDDKRAALNTINAALSHKEISDSVHAFFLKGRAQTYYAFKDIDNAQSDLHAAAEILNADPDIVSLQAKIWATQGRELDNAYDYAMTLVKRNPTDIFAWDTLGAVVYAREGVEAALEMLTRVGAVANRCSSLFERMGDMYVEIGETGLARDAYMRAINLSGDGLTIINNVKKKLRKLN